MCSINRDSVDCLCFSHELQEGKLRILQHSGADVTSMGLNCYIEENMLEVVSYFPYVVIFCYLICLFC